MSATYDYLIAMARLSSARFICVVKSPSDMKRAQEIITSEPLFNGGTSIEPLQKGALAFFLLGDPPPAWYSAMEGIDYEMIPL